jgi:hypothetical protein
MTGTIRGRGIDDDGQHHPIPLTFAHDHPPPWCCRTAVRRAIVEDVQDDRLKPFAALRLLDMTGNSMLAENCPAHPPPLDPWRTP